MRAFFRKGRDFFVALVKPAPVEMPEDFKEEHALTDTRKPARLGLWVLGAGFGGFLLWAALAPLDEGVPTSGMVVVDTKRKAVQHLAGGIIKTMHVKEGQFVQSGAPLLEIDAAATQANFENARFRYYSLRATEDRLKAEQNHSEMAFHPDLLSARNDPLIDEIVSGQRRLLVSRRDALINEIAAMKAAIQGHQAAIEGYRGVLGSRHKQLRLLQEEAKGLRDLVDEGYAPRNNWLALERMISETLGFIAELEGNIARTERAVAETRLRMTQREAEFRKEVDTQLADVKSQVEAENERFLALADDLKRTVIRAPADGQVVGLAAQTVGGIIAPGQKIMDVVPRDEVLLLETQVPPHLIDRVMPGREADVRFSAFANSPQVVIPGKVESVATDLLVNEQTGAHYYLARVSVTEKGLGILGARQMQAGMPAEVIIVTGERSLLTYLLRPLLKRIAVSMKEE
ncbi:MAG: HlyD family type I secretion periplasmic adaptor subunit [Betaproteobacteria bacterium]|nr:HlyD family type I secretion periplasmic adaptor subunit [Betaproteobacteria bacterium]MCL2886727.1 HlyD family type I secretion periplasmic adaptor subunit [Betaproteobacteria bacterium]